MIDKLLQKIILIFTLTFVLIISISFFNIDNTMKTIYYLKSKISNNQTTPSIIKATKKVKKNYFLLQKNIYITELFFIINNGYYQASQENIIKEHLYNILDRGCSAIDIGASDGRTLQPMADKSVYGKIIAFEPFPDFYTLLEGIFGRYYNVTIENCALYDKSGDAVLYSYTNNPFEGGLSPREDRMQKEGNNNGNLVEIPVKTKTLDEYIDEFETLDLIKIDTEASEMNILLGGENLIKKFRPVIITEFGGDIKYFNHIESELFDYTERNDYYLCDLFGNIFHSRMQWNNYLKGVTWDFILIPKEKYKDIIEKISY